MASTAWSLSGNAGTNASNNFLGTTDAQPLVIKTDGAERLRVDTSGNLALRTTTTWGLLSIGGSYGIKQVINDGSGVTDYNCGLGTDLTIGAGNSFDVFMGYGEPTNLSGDTSVNIVAPTGPWPYPGYRALVTVRRSGNVGIGTSTPSSVLEVSGPAPGPALTLTNTSGGGGGGVNLAFNTYPPPANASASSVIGVIDDGNYGNSISISTRASGAPTNGLVERILISSNGNIGIGLSERDEREGEPSSMLVVAGDEEIYGRLQLSGMAEASDRHELYFADNGQIRSLDDNHRIIFNRSGNELEFREYGTITFSPGATQGQRTARAFIDSSGNLSVTGDVLLTGADCAEEFDTSGCRTLDLGTVVVIDDEGALQESCEAYDKRVAGVISGAGEYRHGLVLDKRPSEKTRMPLALVGKTFCKVDATISPVETGDLLTTSPNPGHAMKATDPDKAFAATVGKALAPLRRGTGLVPILVALQ